MQPFAPVLRDDRDYWLAYPAARRRSPGISAFRDWVLDQAARELERLYVGRNVGASAVQSASEHR